MRTFLTAIIAGLVFGSFTPPALAQVRDLPDFADLVERVGPAVVNIRTTERVRGGFSANNQPDNEDLQELFRRFFGVPMPQPPTPGPSPRGKRDRGDRSQPEREVTRGVGSGFIISADGYVITNAHVVENASEIYVTMTDEREFKGKVIGVDKRTDVALVKIDATGLPKMAIGESKNIRVGQWVLAIGSPFGLKNTVTAGIVSAKGRETGELLPFIQTDVAVNPGNSGGPLINTKGEVIGINSQILSDSGGSIGISFAIPVDEAMRVVEQLKTSGHVTRGRLGVEIGEVTKEVAEALGLPKAHGAVVGRVEAGTPAEKAGVLPGDIILKFDGRPIEKSSDLPRAVGDTKPGNKSTLQVWRKGVTRDLPIVVGELDVESKVVAKSEETAKSRAVNGLGLSVSDLSDEKKKQLGVTNGVLVDAAEGPAAVARLQRGDVIVALNNVDIGNAKQFNELSAKLDPKKAAFVLIRRGERAVYLPIRPAQK